MSIETIVCVFARRKTMTQRLAGRMKELEERYARPLPELEREVEAFGAKVEGHLKRMGLGAVR